MKENRKKPCRCGHGTGIHHRTAKDKREVCNHPDCDCKGYVAAQPKEGEGASVPEPSGQGDRAS